MTVEHAGLATNDVGIPYISIRVPGKAHSPREDVLKISHGSESCENVSFLLTSRLNRILHNSAIPVTREPFEIAQ